MSLKKIIKLNIKIVKNMENIKTCTFCKFFSNLFDFPFCYYFEREIDIIKDCPYFVDDSLTQYLKLNNNN